jgi:hypothetical protein
MIMLNFWFDIHRTGLSILEIAQNLKDVSDIKSGDDLGIFWLCENCNFSGCNDGAYKVIAKL